MSIREEMIKELAAKLVASRKSPQVETSIEAVEKVDLEHTKEVSPELLVVDEVPAAALELIKQRKLKRRFS